LGAQYSTPAAFELDGAKRLAEDGQTLRAVELERRGRRVLRAEGLARPQRLARGGIEREDPPGGEQHSSVDDHRRAGEAVVLRIDGVAFDQVDAPQELAVREGVAGNEAGARADEHAFAVDGRRREGAALVLVGAQLTRRLGAPQLAPALLVEGAEDVERARDVVAVGEHSSARDRRRGVAAPDLRRPRGL